MKYLNSAEDNLLLKYYIIFSLAPISYMSDDPIAILEASFFITKLYLKFGSYKIRRVTKILLQLDERKVLRRSPHPYSILL